MQIHWICLASVSFVTLSWYVLFNTQLQNSLWNLHRIWLPWTAVRVGSCHRRSRAIRYDFHYGCVTLVWLFSFQYLVFIPVDFFQTRRGLLHPGLKLTGNTFAQFAYRFFSLHFYRSELNCQIRAKHCLHRVLVLKAQPRTVKDIRPHSSNISVGTELSFHNCLMWS